MTSAGGFTTEWELNAEGFHAGLDSINRGMETARERVARVERANADANSGSTRTRTRNSRSASQQETRDGNNTQRERRKRDANRDSDERKRRANETREAKRRRADAEREQRGLEQKVSSDAGNLSSAAAAPFKAMIASIIGGGILSFIGQVTTGAAALGRLSDNTATSIGDLQSWDRAAQRAGAEAGEMSDHVKKSAIDIARYQTGLGFGEGMAEFMRRGGKVEELKDANSYLTAQARILKGIADIDPTKAFAIGQAMGLSEGAFNLLKQGPAAVQALTDAQRKNGVITRDTAEQAALLQGKWLDLKDRAIAGLTDSLIAAWPAIEQFANGFVAKFDNMAKWVSENRSEISRWASNIASGVETASNAIGKIVDTLGGLKNVLIILLGLKVAGWAIGIAGAIGSAITGVVAMAGAFKTIFGVVAGLTGVLAVITTLIAGAAGLLTGTIISKNLSDESQDVIGGTIATVMAAFGSDDAQKALDANLKAKQQPQIPLQTKQPASTAPVAPVAPATAKKEAADVADFFVKKGWTKEQAAGIAANLQAESSFNHKAQGDKNKKTGKYDAYGVAQWHPDRQAKFKEVTGKDIRQSTQSEQLSFVDWELRNTESKAGKALAKTSTAQEAAAVVSRKYERPEKADAEAAKRGALAEQIVRMQAAPPVPTVGAASSQPIVQAGSRQQAGAAESNTQVSIANMTINAGGAADAKGIAQSIGPEIQKTTQKANQSAMQAFATNGQRG